VKSKIDRSLDIAVKQLQDWGITVTQRAVPLAEGKGLLAHDLGIAAFEADHPLEASGGV